MPASPSTSLHGDLNQSRRTRNLSLLTSGRVKVLVATDVAARGIHVDDITLVIQADAPEEYKTYLHRAGRTGRAGKQGTVVTLIPKSRRRRMEELLDRAEIDAEVDYVVPGDGFSESSPPSSSERSQFRSWCGGCRQSRVPRARQSTSATLLTSPPELREDAGC